MYESAYSQLKHRFNPDDTFSTYKVHDF